MIIFFALLDIHSHYNLSRFYNSFVVRSMTTLEKILLFKYILKRGYNL
jgi:hypothetical protein